MNRYAVLRSLCGLTLSDAAAFHHARIDSVKNWSSGRGRPPPAGVVDELRELARRQRAAADAALADLGRMDPDEIVLGYPTDNKEAQAMGWPSVGAWGAVAAQIAAASDRPVLMVPRGATIETAGAADAREGAV